MFFLYFVLFSDNCYFKSIFKPWSLIFLNDYAVSHQIWSLVNVFGDKSKQWLLKQTNSIIINERIFLFLCLSLSIIYLK